RPCPPRRCRQSCVNTSHPGRHLKARTAPSLGDRGSRVRKVISVSAGDRYLGHGEWEHYLGFEQHPAPVKAIKLSMIHLGSEDVGEDVVIRPGSRYAIVKVTNGTM